MSLQVDEQQARRFLEALAPDEQVFVFQTFDDKKERKARHLSRVLVGTLDSVLPVLNTLQTQGAGVFVQVQGGAGRGQDAITHGRAVFVDADDPDDLAVVVSQVKSELPAPSAVVESSTGKVHFYWFTEAVDQSVTSSLIAELADIAGTDPSVQTPERVMRLPGSWHLKQQPVQVRVRALSTERRYAVGQIQSAVRVASRRGARRVTGGGGAFVTMYDPVFGLPVVEADDMDVLASGNRTQKLISYIGRLVGDGYSAQWIEAEVRRVAAERLPEGDTPISEAAWQNEILPAIHRFQAKQEGGAVVAPAQVQHTPPVAVPGLPEVPPSAPGGVSMPPLPPQQLPQNNWQEQISDRPNVNLAMETWVERFVWIEQGQFVVDTTKPLVSGCYSAADFEKSHKNHKVDNAQTFNKWLTNSFRRTMRDFIFAPGSGQVVVRDKALYFNTFEPPEPLLEAFSPDQMVQFEDHMAFLFPDPDAWWRMMNWFVFTVAQPQTRVPWAPVLVSGEGRGKSWLFECVKAMFDGRYTSAVETKDLESQFNGYMADTILVCFEEVHTRSKHETIDKFKTLITNPTLEINEKHGRKGQREIFANVFMTTNHDDALALAPDKDSRRYWVYAIKQARMADEDGYNLYQWLKTSGPKHLLNWCLSVDQSSWQFNAWPEYTAAKDTMVKANMSLVTRALVECMDDRVGVFQLDIGDERQVEDTIAAWLDQDRLDKRQKAELKHLLRKYAEPLRRLRLGKHYIRLLVWRHKRQWVQADDGMVLREYERCKRAALGQDVGPPMSSVGG